MACRRSAPERRLGAWIAVVILLVAAAAVASDGQADARAPEPGGGPALREVGAVAGGYRLAATANGQAGRCLDSRRGAVLAFEPDRWSDEPRIVVGPGTNGTLRAVACLPGDVVVVVVDDGTTWWLRTYRIEPGVAANPAAPLQELSLGGAGEATGPIGIAVSSARGWLAVTGLPPPLPPVLRAALAGVRVGPLSDRSCPQLPAGRRPVAVTVSPRDELVLVLEPSPPAASPAAAIGSYDLAGRQRALFETELTRVQAIAFDRRGTALCATATSMVDGRSGIWRLEAEMRQGRQAVRPVLLAPHPSPGDLVAIAERSLMMLSSEPIGTLFALDPTPPLPADPEAPPGDQPP